MSTVDSEELKSLDAEIEALQIKLEQAKLVVKQWTDTSTQLARNVAEARAKTQGMGRGLGGAILGSKFRASMRHSAAQTNARISKEVAEKRAKIAVGKMQAQEVVRETQVALSSAKERRKALVALTKTQKQNKAAATKDKMGSLTLLEKLKEAHDLGLLTEEEYEAKRQKLVSDL